MSFATDVSKFVAKTKIKPDLVVRKLGLDLLRGAMLKSPVDTGRFRASWRVGINKVDKSTSKLGIARDKKGRFTSAKKSHADKGKTGMVDQQALAEGTAKIANAKFGGTLYVTNNVPYAIPLENGHSKQAPGTGAIMKRTANEVFGTFKKAVAAVKDA